ncbi:MAG: DJ-1/PfpI family protein [Candidatus Omnitrophica bacterium]|nr:DJ-1/PfpI family protein [Candidatus Omnitrophota bacterium]
MPKAIIILADGFEDIEAVTPIDLLRRANVEVTVAGLDSVSVTGARGKIRITADTILDKAGVDYDAVILPGGMPGAANLAKSEKIRSLIIEMNKKGKIIAAICAAPALVLSPLGILNNKNATCFPGMENEFNPTTKFLKEQVVVDGKIITSRGAGTAFLFGLALVEALAGKKMRDEIALKTVYQ